MNWIVWSEEHGAWWRDSKWGYTRSLVQAGRFSQTQAEEIARTANQYCVPPEWNECAFPDPLAEEAK